MTDNKQLTDVTMPQLAESLVSATIGKWLKKPGDPVEQYEPLCEVITDKVNAELPSTVDGVMGDILAEEGQTVAVGEVICRIAVPAPAAPAPAPASAAPKPPLPRAPQRRSARFPPPQYRRRSNMRHRAQPMPRTTRTRRCGRVIPRCAEPRGAAQH